MSLFTGASLVLAAAIVAAASDARAQFYLGAQGGWTALEGAKGSVTGTNPITGITTTVPVDHSFNDGFNVGARAGYMFGPWRFEGEYSYRENGSNATVVGARVNGTLSSNTLMFNGIYDFQFGWPVTPHIGLGLGGATLDGNFNARSVGYRSRASDVVFAYQAIAGVRYLINPTIALDLDYRYRGTSGMNYTTNAVTVGGVTFPSRNISGNGNTHNIVASLSWLFLPAPLPPPPAMEPAPPPPPPPIYKGERG
jgi:opacity protein-like surface antigen